LVTRPQPIHLTNRLFSCHPRFMLHCTIDVDISLCELCQLVEFICFSVPKFWFMLIQILPNPASHFL
jgi:hypothetical protein